MNLRGGKLVYVRILVAKYSPIKRGEGEAELAAQRNHSSSMGFRRSWKGGPDMKPPLIGEETQQAKIEQRDLKRA